MVEKRTAALWAAQNRHDGDRLRLFAAVHGAIGAARVLYAGSFVDVAASMVFDDVTYVDIDKRMPKFFGDEAGVREIVDSGRASDARYRIDHIHADYHDDLGLVDQAFDLLVSLYAGFVSEHCTRYLRIGGTLLVNPSHGDAAMASIDPRYTLSAAVIARNGQYRVTATNLDQYLVAKKPEPLTVDRLHELGRGIAYTKPAFAYLFRRVS